MENKGRTVQSVEKALFLLDCFWDKRGEYSLQELTQKTGWAKSTVHALLRTMLETSVVEQDPATGKYRLGYHAFELGCVAQEWWTVCPVAAYHMRGITERTGESLYLAMRCGFDALLVESSESWSNFKVTAPKGGRMPLYGCAQGKIFLAQMPEQELESYLRAVSFQRYTPYTIGNAEQLRKELNMIRVQGFATQYGELRTGIKSVAAPIFNPDGSCTYAIGAVTIAQGSASGESFHKLRDVVMQAAEEITREMNRPNGWRGK